MLPIVLHTRTEMTLPRSLMLELPKNTVQTTHSNGHSHAADTLSADEYTTRTRKA